MKRTSIIPIRWINEQHDTDCDGVPNFRDCNPWNPFEHYAFKEDLIKCWSCGRMFYPTDSCPFCGAFVKGRYSSTVPLLLIRK